MINNNEAQVNVEEKIPDYYEIQVQRHNFSPHYGEVTAFQIEDQMLKIADKTSTYVIPINDSVEAIKITPVYLEEKRIVQIP